MAQITISVPIGYKPSPDNSNPENSFSIISLQEITYSSLKIKRDNGELIPGTLYRITDYKATTKQTNTKALNNLFDIIVAADTPYKLNENAKAVPHYGDTYFGKNKLEAWELKYSLDNDVKRFAWADSTNGMGVIYYLRDEYDNECSYDFKNIQILKDSEYVFTFHSLLETDDSLTGASHNNIIKEYNIKGVQYINMNTFGFSCIGNILKLNCHNNSLLNNCDYNIFGHDCSNNSLGNDCIYNNFGNNCDYNTFGSLNSHIDYCQYITYENGVCYTELTCQDVEASNTNKLQNVHICEGVLGTASNSFTIAIPDRNLQEVYYVGKPISDSVPDAAYATPDDINNLFN